MLGKLRNPQVQNGSGSNKTEPVYLAFKQKVIRFLAKVLAKISRIGHFNKGEIKGSDRGAKEINRPLAVVLFNGAAVGSTSEAPKTNPPLAVVLTTNLIFSTHLLFGYHQRPTVTLSVSAMSCSLSFRGCCTKSNATDKRVVRDRPTGLRC